MPIAGANGFIEPVSDMPEAKYSGPTGGKFIAPIQPIADKTDWIEISDRAGLESMKNNLNGKYYLSADIDLDGAEWVPINSFTGTFDGQGYVIRNLTIGTTENPKEIQYAGLFGRVSNATIKNVGLESTYINISFSFGSSYAGGICGYGSVYENGITISNCYNTGDISSAASSTGSSAHAGGIFGRAYIGEGVNGFVTINNCYNTGDIYIYYSSSNPFAGGIGGRVYIDRGDNSITINISNCYNTGAVSTASTTSSYVGGICGDGSVFSGVDVFITISNCYNTGAVSSFGNAGGICGNGSVITGVDGFININNCYNTGAVSSSRDAGGICGFGSNSVSNCYNTGDVFVSSSFSSSAGGICGYSSSTISNCYNTGDVFASTTTTSSLYSYAGGISGSSSTIINCYNTGAVSSSSSGSDYINSGSSAGGIDGRGGTIDNCYNIGDVYSSSNYASSRAGGIFGYGYAIISNCYNTGSVSATSGYASYAGGIFGYGEQYSSYITIISNCYWSSESTQTLNGNSQSPKKGEGGGTYTGITTSLTTDEMKQQSSFVGFDFADVWAIDPNMNNGYPYLCQQVINDDDEITTDFKDANFLAAVREIIGKPTEAIYKSDVENITSLDVSNKEIESLAGIKHFTGLTGLYCEENKLTELDVSNNTALTEFDCHSNQLTELDVSNNTALTWFDCGWNELTALDVSNNTSLEWLYCRRNQLTELDISNNTMLTWLDCIDNKLTSLFLQNNTALTHLECGWNQLTDLDVSKNTKLTGLWCYWNKIKKLDVTNNIELTLIECSDNNLTELDVSNNTKLTELWCYENYMESTDDVIGWLEIGLIEDDTFLFYPQKTSPITTYTISYNANGGTGVPSAQTKTHDISLTLSTTKPTRTGYTFLGWSTSNTATTATYQAGGSYTANTAVTLYAVWQTATVAPTITTTSLPNGTTGTAYSQTLTATGTTPITWSIASGSLPIGLALSTSGTISGTPLTTELTTYLFTVEATNSAGSDTESLSITINAAATPGGKFIAPIEPIADKTGWIEIKNRAGLEAMANNLSGKYYLSADIDLAGKDWMPIGTFTGTFDGQGYVIRNLTIGTDINPTEIQYAGLFGRVSNATIKNLGLEGTYINATSSFAQTGGIFGRGEGSITISNCYNTGAISSISVSSNAHAGGICGSSYASSTNFITISNCYNTGNISASSASSTRAGGICGYNNGSDSITISNCYNTGAISSISVSSNAFAGGICGSGSRTISNCYNTGDVSASSSSSDSYPASAGGICGSAGGIVIISNCYNTGTVSAFANNTSSWDADISACAGGIFGYGGYINSSVTINNCYNTGVVSAYFDYSYVGGIYGSDYGSGTIIIINCYWNSDSEQMVNGAPVAVKKGVGNGTYTGETTPLTTAQMKQQSSFVGFDFADVWAIDPAVNNGYPVLQALTSFIPSPVETWNGHTYQVFDMSMTWTEAKAYCESLGGHLATITSQEEQDFIETLIKDGTKNYYWLGGTDEKIEGEWCWVSGETWSYTNWNANEPFNYSIIDDKSEEYLQIIKNSGKWNDLQNSGDSSGDCILSNIGFICEWENEPSENDVFDKLESEHFIWDASTDYLKGNITSANFELWLSRLDIVYDTYVDLVGREPFDGAKIYIKDSNEHWGALWVYGDNNIYWQENGIKGAMQTINNGSWDFGVMHEIGHLFDEYGYWNFNAEFLANLKILYALETTSAKTSEHDELKGGTYLRNLWYNNATESYNQGNLETAIRNGNDNLHFYFSPIIDNAGWEVFQSAFRSYFDDSFTQEHVYIGSSDAVKLADFLDRLTYFNNGNDVLQYSADKGVILKKIYPVTITTPVSIPDGTYYIESALATDMVLDCENASHEIDAKVLLRHKDGGTNQQIRVESVGSDYVKLIFVHSDKAAVVWYASYDEGMDIIQCPYNGTQNDEWKMIDAGEGYYYIQNRRSGKYLSVNGGQAIDKSGICQTSEQTTARKWKFVPVENQADNPNGKFIAPIEPIADKTDWIEIKDRAGLESMANNLSGKYYLSADIDLAGKDWVPIGTSPSNVFKGTFDGQGYVIMNLTIGADTNPTDIEYAGLFGYANGATIKNVGLEGIYINIASTSSYSAGGCLVGSSNSTGTITNCYATGDVFVSSSSYSVAGGLIGSSYINSTDTITNCYVTGDVSASASASSAGGLIGSSYSYSNYTITMKNCYATGDVSASSSGSFSRAGGLVGYSFSTDTSTITITNCYATGDVSASASASSASAGGLIGDSSINSSGTITITNCYATGDVSASSAGGLVGYSSSTVTINNCYWNSDSEQMKNGSPVAEKKGVGYGTDITTSLTTDEMKQQSSFGGFDFADVWAIDPAVNNGYPYFRSLGGGGSSTVAPTITISTLPNGTKGTVYSQNLEATGTTPITWNIASGSLPSGLTLSTSGTISGTPTTSGTFTFTVKATNSTGSITKQLSIVINAAHISVTSITGVPTSVTAKTALTLTGIVNPSNATNKAISWSVVSAGTTGATISGNILNTTAAGEVTIRATIANGTAVGTDYTQDFKITVNELTATKIILGKVFASKGGTATVPVVISNNPGLSDVTLTFQYDSDLTLLEFVSDGVTMGIDSVSDEANNTVLLSNSSVAGFTGDTLLYLRFQISSAATLGNKSISISSGSASDKDSNNLPIPFEPGHVEVINFLYGDVNGDGEVLTNDLTLLRRHFANWSNIIIHPGADVNGDGEVLTNDLTILRRYFANWPGIVLGPNQITPLSSFSLYEFSDTPNTTGISTPTITIGTIYGQKGETVDVAVTIEGNPGLADAALEFQFDNDLTLREFITDSSTMILDEASDVKNKTALLTNASPAGFTGTTLVILRFDVSETVADGMKEISVTTTKGLSDKDANNVNLNIVSGGIMIVTPEIIGERIIQPKTTRESLLKMFEAGTEIKIQSGAAFVGTGSVITLPNGDRLTVIVYGDTTGNGIANIEDAQLFLEYLVGNTDLTPAQILALNGIDDKEDSAIKKLRKFLQSVMTE